LFEILIFLIDVLNFGRRDILKTINGEEHTNV